MNDSQSVKFDTHSFSFECYDAGDMRVAYAQHSHHICINRIGRKKLHIDDRRPVVGALPGYAAFSGPVQIAWRTREGDQFNQVLHLERIFRERVVQCERTADRIFQAAPFAPGSPVVLVEVNGRSVNVYLDACLQLILSGARGAGLGQRRIRSLAYSRSF